MIKHLAAATLVAGLAASAGADVVFDDCDLSAGAVSHFDQGLRNDGAPVDNAFSDPAKALGPAEIDETVNYVSLGFGGELILEFGQKFTHAVSVWETTYEADPAYYPESADIFVGVGSSWDTADWALVTNLSNDADGLPLSLEGAAIELGTDAFDFLRIVDTTSGDLHDGFANGFDVDGICTHAVPSPGPLTLAGLGLVLAGVRRTRPAGRPRA